MRVLFDTNVVLDVLLAREPHVEVAAQLFSLADNGVIAGILSATTVTTIHYIASKTVGAAAAARHIEQLLAMFDVACVDRPVLQAALALDYPDFEDAVLHEAARTAGAEAIVTRNVKDFTSADLPVFEPRELLAAVIASSAE
ncbi:MAG: PIN domain-containing protein [Coriobacteriia bacterium]|nr:PIN domain-containing protein [Coriobacteriia bacterium]MDZ4654946.1 PIN domain-containing protein [Coriobacteriia bacterium]